MISHDGGIMKISIKLSLLFSQMIFFILLPIGLELTNYVNPLVVVVVWVCLSAAVLFFVCFVKHEKIRISERILHLLMFLYLIGLLILLFFRPENQTYGTVNLVPFDTIRMYLSGHFTYIIPVYNLGANIALFIPFGLYYQYIARKPQLKQLFAISTLIVSIIEGLQFFTKRGSLDIDDVILNVLGVCIGYFLYPLFQKVVFVKQNGKYRADEM
jgi:glycopeptide antibiotics resistance protein